MWWQTLLGVLAGAIAGAAIYWGGWQIGYRYGITESSAEKYVEAMTDDEV